jgi:hypothetical protein
MHATIAEQVAEARQWIEENFPAVALARAGSSDQVRHFVKDNYPAGGWFGFLADNYL